MENEEMLDEERAENYLEDGDEENFDLDDIDLLQLEEEKEDYEAKYKELHKEHEKMRKALVAQKKKSKLRTNDEDDDLDAKLDARLEMRDFYKNNPDASDYKEEIEAYAKKGISRDDAYFLSTRKQEENKEKAYFYNNPNDTEARKAYVMRWDKIIVDNEKSTENMIFATYTNSSWKTTEWYLEKDAIQPVKILSMDEIKKISQCHRQYNLIDNSSNKMMVEFYFVGKCQKRDTVKTLTNNMETPIFTPSSWQKVYARMFSKQNPPSDGVDDGAGIYKNLGEDTFFIQWNQISLEKYVGDDEENPPFYEFVIKVKFNSNHKTHSLILETDSFDSKKEMEKQYDDMLWTMKNGFFIKES